MYCSAIKSPEKVLQPYREPRGGPSNKSLTKKRTRKVIVESQTIKYFWRGRKKFRKHKTYCSAIQCPDKSTTALYRAPASIVVYLKSPCRRPQKANVLRRHRDRYPGVRVLSLVQGECTTPPQRQAGGGGGGRRRRTGGEGRESGM